MVKDFQSASQEVLEFLHDRFGFDLWMVTRTEGEDYIVLSTEEHGYDIHPGQVIPWEDTFCVRMMRGEGPRVAPDVSRVPAYMSAPGARGMTIGTYVGVPLLRDDGSYFGTLCGIDPHPHTEELVDDQKLVELLASLLGRILDNELKSLDQTRRAERLDAEANRDALTGLFNRRGWEFLLAREEERCVCYGNPATIVSIDLDDLKLTNDTQGHEAGDDLLRRAAMAIQEATRSSDITARIGGDEFAVLAPECDAAAGQALVDRLHQSLARHNVRASIGMAVRRHDSGISAAVKEADAAMYQVKKARKAGRQN